MTRKIILTILVIISLGVVFSCDKKSTENGDVFTNHNCETNCTGHFCVAAIMGKVQKGDGTPIVESKVQICIPQCFSYETDEKGEFFFAKPKPLGADETTPHECMNFDFNTDEPIHINVIGPTEEKDEMTRYSIAYAPRQSDLKDYIFDIGTHILFDLPYESALYTKDDGASVNLSDIEMEMDGGVLLADGGVVNTLDNVDTADIKIFKASLSTWDPPFVNNPYIEGTPLSLDALYYFSPFWKKINGDLPVQIAAPAGWADGEDGRMLMLGDFYIDYLTCGTAHVPVGELGECDQVTAENGKITTSKIPRFGWVGLKKN